MNNNICDNHHIFIFAVCGRSSSTALQRILNSSHEICIWGEQHLVVDHLMNIIHQLDQFMKDGKVYRDVLCFHSSFKEKYHLYPYANAIGNLQEFQNSLIEALCHHLKPTDSGIERFGFKAICLKSKITLQVLSETFSNCQFIFLFRNPIDQWPSVNHVKWWVYSHKLEDFLQEYRRISTIILDYVTLNKECIVLENSGIQQPDVLQKVLDKVNIKKAAPEVVKRKVFSVGDISLPDDGYAEMIKNHPAYANYLALRKLQIS